jgi:hypothetical protein
MSQAQSPSHLVNLEGNLEIRRHQGREAVRALAAPLAAAGFLPAAVPGMDPGHLAQGIEGEDPVLLAAYRDDRIVAYMTYALRSDAFPVALGSIALARLPYRQLRVFGYASRDDGRAPILEIFLKTLLESDAWHVAQLFELPIDDPLCRYLADASFDGRYRVVPKFFDTIQVRLDESFESYLKNQFTKKSRYNLKREVRLLEQAAPVTMKVYTSPGDAADFLRLAEGIAKRTYHSRLGLATIRATPALLQRTACLAQHGRFRSYILFIGDAPAAYCYATIRQGELSYDNVAYEPQFAKLNPGKVLLYKILEELHQSRVVPQLEFGRGMAEYKVLFANSRRRVVDMNVYSYRPYPQSLRLVAAAAELGYQSLRPLLRPWMPVIKRMFRDAVRLLVPGMLDAPDIISQLSFLLA